MNCKALFLHCFCLRTYAESSVYASVPVARLYQGVAHAYPIDACITPSLHSENVRQLDGYSDERAVSRPRDGNVDDAYLTLGKIHDARDHASRNQA